MGARQMGTGARQMGTGPWGAEVGDGREAFGSGTWGEADGDERVGRSGWGGGARLMKTGPWGEARASKSTYMPMSQRMPSVRPSRRRLARTSHACMYVSSSRKWSLQP